MRKKSTRLLSAALAACMMASVLPVSAFADGGTGSETGGDPQQGEVIKEFPREGGIIEEGGTYNLCGEYKGCLYLKLEPGDSAVVNVTGDVHSEVGEQEAVLALQSGNVIINNMDNHVFTVTGPAKGGGRCYYNSLYTNAEPETTINGGIYKCSMSNLETLFNHTGILRLNNVTSMTEGGDAVNNWEKTYITGGEYDSGTLTILNRNSYSYIEFDGNVRVQADQGNALCNYGTAVIRNGTYTNGGTAPTVGNVGTLTFNAGTITAPNGAAILNTSGKALNGVYCTGVTTINGGTLKDSKYGIQVSSGEKVTLNDVTFSNNENDIYLMKDRMITIADSFTKRATIKVKDPSEGRRLTEGENGPGLNLVSNDPGYKVAYNETGKYYYLTPRTGYTLTAKKATATDKDDVVITPDDDINEGTPVTLTADEAPEGQKFTGWTVTKTVNGVEVDITDELRDVSQNGMTIAELTMPGANVTIEARFDDDSQPPEDQPVVTDDGSGDIVAGVVIGGIAAVGAYEVGTGLYRITQMDDVAMPTNRIALAKLMWERAGKPEPESTALYSDISAEDTDAQKAARWAVEQELLKDDTNEDEQKFHPAFPVSKLRVCLTWEKAKQKGLFDQNTEA